MNRYKSVGWRQESARHSLASRGIKTGRNHNLTIGKKIDYGLKVLGGYSSRKFKYKGITFNLQRADDGAGWYCDMAYLTSDNTVVDTDYWTGGDTHYYRLKDVISGLKEEVDAGKYTIKTGHKYRMAQDFSKRKPYNEDSGYIASKRSAKNRGWVVIYDAKEQGLDNASGRYAVVCQTHNRIVNTKNMPDARTAMKQPSSFCEDCRQ